MRRALTAILAVPLVLLAMPATPAHAASDAKVVVIVGPAGSSTAHYKEDADQVVAEARRWTANVVKVYTPDATWAAVRAAAQDASILVYLGHGNGWPSRYAPFQTLTKDGFGLDPTSGADSTRTVYYGEEYIRRDIRLAPNAVVLLYHLCYASGNTEPGLPTGSFTDVRQRVDNYGAGFIGAGARAVFAEGHPAHPVVHGIRELFTSNRTMLGVFRAAPTFRDNLRGPYASQRTPGLTFVLDPDSAQPAGFYRSLIGDLSLTAAQVVGPRPARTDAAPADLVAPCAAEVVAADGAGLWNRAVTAAEATSPPSAVLPAGTRLRLASEAAPAADGTRVFAVTVLGGPGEGFVRATALAPRDSTAPTAWTLDRSSAWLSPNDDGTSDALVVTARFSEAVAAVLRVRNAAGTTVRTISITGDLARFEWSLRTAAGTPVPDGEYAWSLRAADAWGNPAWTADGAFTVDATAPVTTASSEATAGDEGWLVSPAAVTMTARDALSGVRSISWRVNGGTATTYDRPTVVDANGTVTLEYRAVDNAGIREAWNRLTLRIDTRPPVIRLALSGTAGDAVGTWRGPVSITPTITDETSGVAVRRYRVDGADPVALGADPIVVTGAGPHTVTVIARDTAGNRATATETFTIDTSPPTIEVPAPGGTIPTVTPNGDGVSETVELPFRTTETGSVTAAVTTADGAVVRTLVVAAAGGEGRLAWDGRTDDGAAVPDGRYAVRLVPRDLAGNEGEMAVVEVDAYAALAALTRSPVLFFPQDGDRLAPRTTASWMLASPAAVSIRVLDAGGAVVRTGPTGAAYPAGAARWAWNGKDDRGAWAPRGTYRIDVRATNGTQAASLLTAVHAEAFRVATSRTSAVRGKALSVTATSAEPLAGAPRLVVRQPGMAAWSVTMTKVRGSTWTATVTPRRGGDAGTLRLVVKAVDSRGGVNSTTVRRPLE